MKKQWANRFWKVFKYLQKGKHLPFNIALRLIFIIKTHNFSTFYSCVSAPSYMAYKTTTSQKFEKNNASK